MVDGGTPTRTGTIDAGCASSKYPSAVRSTAGLFPNQILTAYGIASLQSQGLKGQGMRVAILGEAPTSTSFPVGLPLGNTSWGVNCFDHASSPVL